MKPFPMLLMAGVMTAGATALAGYAYAGEGGLKTLILQLPGGGVEQVRYSGPAAPQIMIMPAPAAVPAAFLAPSPAPAAATNPFAQMDRISAIMNAQMASLMGQMGSMMMPPMLMSIPMPVPAAFGPVVPGGGGVTSYSFISATSGGPQGACMESVQILSQGPGKPPQVLSRRAGHCGVGSGFAAQPMAAPVPAMREQARQAPAPKLIPARAELPLQVPRPSQS